MITPFREWRAKFTPAWLQTGEGGLLGEALDFMKDAFLERVFNSLLVRFPDAAPDDALVTLGRDRRVFSSINPDDDYRARLKTWLDDRELTGCPFDVIRAISTYTGPIPRIRIVDARGNWYTREFVTLDDYTDSYLLDEGNWDWDGTLRRSRFWVILYPGTLWEEETGSLEVANDDELDPYTEITLGTTATAEHVAMVRAIVADSKPNGTRCMGIIIALDDASFDPSAPEPDGTWGGFSVNDAGTQVFGRLATARYWEGSKGAA